MSDIFDFPATPPQGGAVSRQATTSNASVAAPWPIKVGAYGRPAAAASVRPAPAGSVWATPPARRPQIGRRARSSLEADSSDLSDTEPRPSPTKATPVSSASVAPAAVSGRRARLQPHVDDHDDDGFDSPPVTVKPEARVGCNRKRRQPIVSQQLTAATPVTSTPSATPATVVVTPPLPQVSDTAVHSTSSTSTASRPLRHRINPVDKSSAAAKVLADTSEDDSSSSSNDDDDDAHAQHRRCRASTRTAASHRRSRGTPSKRRALAVAIRSDPIQRVATRSSARRVASETHDGHENDDDDDDDQRESSLLARLGVAELPAAHMSSSSSDNDQDDKDDDNDSSTSSSSSDNDDDGNDNEQQVEQLQSSGGVRAKRSRSAAPAGGAASRLMAGSYFRAQKSATRISAPRRAFASLLASGMPDDATARRVTSQHEAAATDVMRARGALLEQHMRKFPMWRALARSGFSLMLYGLGSKKVLLEHLAAYCAGRDPVVVLNGFQPTASLRSALQAISTSVLDIKMPSGSLIQASRALARVLGAHASSTTEALPVAELPAHETTPRQRPQRRAGLVAQVSIALAASSRITSGPDLSTSGSSSSAVLRQGAWEAAGLEVASSIDQHVWLVIHNLDGPSMRTPEVQTALSILASAPRLHVLASIDHINAAVLQDQRSRVRAAWHWIDATTYKPYLAETLHAASVLRARADAGASGISYVLRSLTPNHRAVLRILAKHLLRDADADPDDTAAQGMEFEDLLHACLDELVVGSDSALRTHLVELRDHALVASKRVTGGRELLHMPLPRDTVQLLACDE